MPYLKSVELLWLSYVKKFLILLISKYIRLKYPILS